MTDFSLAALTILEAGPAGQIRAAAAAGFSSVGLRLQPLLPTDAVVVGEPAREAEVEARLAETGVRVLEVGVFSIRADLDVRHYAPVVTFSARIDARHLVCPVEDPEPGRRVRKYHIFR